MVQVAFVQVYIMDAGEKLKLIRRLVPGKKPVAGQHVNIDTGKPESYYVCRHMIRQEASMLR